MKAGEFNGVAGECIERTATVDDRQGPVSFCYFLPKPIPRSEEVVLNIETFQKASEAALALGELKGLAKNIGNLPLFVSAYMRKEAVVSSRIEGTIVSLKDVFISEAGNERKMQSEQMKEVRNFLLSMQWGLDKFSERKPIDIPLIHSMHYLLLQNVRGASTDLGAFRKRQNWIGNPEDKNILKAVYIPPAESHVQELMEYLFNYMDISTNPAKLIDIGLMHYYFETIHPYEDGNGRLGRALILLYMMQLNILDVPLLYMSPYFDRNKDQYYELLMTARKTGNYIAWINFFLDGVKEISESTCKMVHKMIELYDSYKKKLGEHRATSTAYELLDCFFKNPYARPTFLLSQFKEEKKNYPLIKRALDTLVECDIITEVSSERRNKLYRANGVLEILDKPF